MNSESLIEHKAGQYIWKIVPPIFLVLGTVGNILTVIVLRRKNIRKSTTAVYLSVLAISDLIVLYTGLLRQWISACFEWDIRHLHSAVCRIHLFLVYFSLDFSGWILISVTFERVILVWFPHSAKSKCSRRSATLSLVTVGVLLMALNGHMLYGCGDFVVTTNNKTEIQKCSYIDKSYEKFFELDWPYIDLTAFCIIPVVCLLIGNILIILKYVQSQKKLHTQVVPTTAASEHKKESKTASMTIMLFTLNTVYLICSVPISIYLIGIPYWVEPSDAQAVAVSDLLWSLCNILMYANNTFNFLLYCFSGSIFREEVKKIICRKKYQSNTVMTLATQTNGQTRYHI